jgi:hypothetical protein
MELLPNLHTGAMGFEPMILYLVIGGSAPTPPGLQPANNVYVKLSPF